MALIGERQRLSTQIFVLQIVIIVLTVVAGFAVSFVQARRVLDARTGETSLAIARTVASMPEVIAGLSAPNPALVIDPIAERVRGATGAAFIVVADDQGIRLSHPNPRLIGTSLLVDADENPLSVLAGNTFIGVQTGSLGRSMRAKVPIRSANGMIVGLVSVGVLEAHVSSELSARLPESSVPPLLGLGLGALGAFLLARRVKRQTFGLEPREIAALLEQREAMLHSVREGALTIDSAGRLTLINDEATRLIGIGTSALGRELADVAPEGRLRDVLTGRVAGLDEVVLVGDRVVVVNRMPVEVHGRPVGAVVTLRDRTDLDGLLHELDDVRTLADALRAQEHEFANRLHVIGGLLELERYAEAVQFVNVNSSLHQELAAALVGQVGDPILSALLLGKASVASERGITLRVSMRTDVPVGAVDSQSLVTILGNLIDNALDSAAHGGTGGHVDVSLGVAGSELQLRVHDSGPGIDPTLSAEIFRDGFTTKVASGTGRRRGLGLALVSQAVHRHDGRIVVDNVDGAVFTVTLPLRHQQGSLEVVAP
ncbi:MAG TPA: sensor histidine kinase [Cellulomonas sp.]|uniref:sensor histidine kinase n=1 Tax=Cellulomonas sp. TaxID=40001 RepID=UPI002E3576D6|nr:sensor histidine kinase [Cellulomonas sp.]HEX5332876.1 sensor histidine kinase [Cellulomonas sp.]